MGDFSLNYHPDAFKYKTFHLKDHPRENIECVFYETIRFIEDAKNNNGRVYVHCVQGISRSSTLCIAYIILSNGLDYNEAFEFIQKKREVINPNLGFIIQLMWFHKRLYKQFDSIPVNPRVYTVCSHQREDPHRIVAKLMMEHFFIDKHAKSMDPRAVYIVQTKERFVIFIGASCKGKNREDYVKYSYEYISELQKREKAAEDISEVDQDNVGTDFWSFWGLEGAPNDPFATTSAWDYWFPDLEKVNSGETVPIVKQMEDYNEELVNEKEFKPRMFTYPDIDASCAVFDEDDLEFDELNLICVKARTSDEENIVDCYEGPEFEERAGLTKQVYIEKVIQKYFVDISRDQVVVKESKLDYESM